MSKPMLFAGLLLTLSVMGHCAAEWPMIEITIGGKTQSFSQGVLLAHPYAAEIHVPRDVDYGTSTTYRAVPLADLLDGTALPADSVLEARGTDGFAAQLPMDFVRNRDPATASHGSRSRTRHRAVAEAAVQAGQRASEADPDALASDCRSSANPGNVRRWGRIFEALDLRFQIRDLHSQL